MQSHSPKCSRLLPGLEAFAQRPLVRKNFQIPFSMRQSVTRTTRSATLTSLCILGAWDS